MNNEAQTDRIGKHFHFDNDFWGAPISLGMLELYQIGEVCCERGFRIRSHEQSVYEITYVISGKGLSYTDGEKIALAEGDLLINSMGHQHAIEASDTDIFRYAYIGFRFSDAEDGGDDEELTELRRCYDEKPWRLITNQRNLLMPFMQCIDEFYTQAMYNRKMIRNYCEQIVIMAIRGSQDIQAPESHVSGCARSGNSAVYAVIRYVEDNIFTLSTIRNMAQDLGYSYTYLSHIFREQTGTTLQNYIQYKKIERSVQLLYSGGLTVSQIATMLNYESVQTFSKSFRRIMGITPAKYVRLGLDNGKALPTSPFEPLSDKNFIGGK